VVHQEVIVSVSARFVHISKSLTDTCCLVDLQPPLQQLINFPTTIVIKLSASSEQQEEHQQEQE